MIPDEARVQTAAEQQEIDAFQNGVYGAEPPEWWLSRTTKERGRLTALRQRDAALTRVEGLLHVWESTNSPFSEMRIHHAVESIRLAIEAPDAE